MSIHQPGKGSLTDESYRVVGKIQETFFDLRRMNFVLKMPVPVPGDDCTEPLGCRHQKIPQLLRNWGWIQYSLGHQTPELLPMETGESVSNRVMNAR